MTTTFSDHLAMMLDPAAFAAACGLEVLDPWQSTLLRDVSPAHDWIALCSRQSGKSACAAVAGLHRCLYRPGSLTLICSAGQRQAQEVLGRATAMYRRIGKPVVAISENVSSLTLENESRLISLPSNASTVRGYTPDFIIIDEAAQCPDSLYQALRPMQIVAGANMWLLSTPFGKRGFFYEQWTEAGDRWRRVKITALECPRIDREWLEAERRTSLWFAAEYMAEFTETSAERVFSDTELDALFREGVESWNVIDR
jgi:Terminase large subunit, T4likevirus-type, N-terminal